MKSSVSRVCSAYELKDLVRRQEAKLTGEHYIVVCPECLHRHQLEGDPGYNKRKLYITKDLSTSYCFVCNTVFVNPRTDDTKHIYEQHGVHLRGQDEFRPIPYIFSPKMDEEAIKYLEGRSSYYSIDQLIKDGFYPDKNKVIINYIYNGQKYFYQIRYIHPIEGRKYYIPSTDFKPLYFAKGEFNSLQPTILTEGAFSSYCLKLVVPEYNVVAVQGKTLTDKQIEMFKEVGGTIAPTFIFMDETEISMNLMNHLKGKHFGKLWVIKNNFDGKDPEDLSKYFASKDEYRNYILENMRKAYVYK